MRAQRHHQAFPHRLLAEYRPPRSAPEADTNLKAVAPSTSSPIREREPPRDAPGMPSKVLATACATFLVYRPSVCGYINVRFLFIDVVRLAWGAGVAWSRSCPSEVTLGEVRGAGHLCDFVQGGYSQG